MDGKEEEACKRTKRFLQALKQAGDVMTLSIPVAFVISI